MARPKAFDRAAALNRAMEAFWRYGYEGTSVQMLVEAMQINRGSLYDTFGDKRALFESAIAHYQATVTEPAIARLTAPDAGKQAIIDHFHRVADRSMADAQRQGCLLTNTVVEIAPHDEAIAAVLRQHLQQVEQAFLQALTQAQSVAALPQQANLPELARYLITCMQGLRVMAKVMPQPSQLGGVVDVMLSALDQTNSPQAPVLNSSSSKT